LIGINVSDLKKFFLDAWDEVLTKTEKRAAEIMKGPFTPAQLADARKNVQAKMMARGLIPKENIDIAEARKKIKETFPNLKM
jgi:hypothetical protein